MRGELIDLDARLDDLGGGWKRTPFVTLRGGTSDEDGPWSDRVADPTRPGEYVHGPAIVVLEVAPDGGKRLIVNGIDAS